MLYTHSTEKLVGLQDLIIKKVETNETETHIYGLLERKPHKCPCCGAETVKIHDYREQVIKDIPLYGKHAFIHLKKRRYRCDCGKRFYEVCTTIESIMEGTVKPNGIVLWRDETDHRPLPLTLQRQVERGLQVLGTRDLRSYTKLLPTLKMFPDAHIVTIDDDIFYPHDFLENLMATYAKKPHSIVGNMVMQMSYDSNGIPTGILQWPYLHEEPADGASHDLFFEGFGGVLYPAGSLPEEVFHKEVFQDICPTADDVWFNAMARISKTPITFCEHGYYDYLKADNHVCQDTALNLINNSENRNDKQLRAVWQHYHLQGQ